MKDIKVIRLFSVIVLIGVFGFSAIKHKGIQYFTNDNSLHNFMINLKEKRYCYQQSTPYELGSKYSQGDIKLIGDTIFIKSDYDIMNLPISVVGNNKSNIEKSKISVTFSIPLDRENSELSKTRIKDYRDISSIIINSKDTVGLKDGFLLYKRAIKKICLIGVIRPQSFYEFELENSQKTLASIKDTVMKQNLLEYLKQLEQDSLANPPNIKSQIVFRTISYVNVNNYNEINLSMDLFDLDNYHTIDDTMIFNENLLLEWIINDTDTVNLRNTVLDSIKKYTTFEKCIDN